MTNRRKSKKAQAHGPEAALAMLQKLLDEKLPASDGAKRRRPNTVRDSIVQRLIKKAAEGNASAFKLLNKHRKEYAKAYEYWMRAKQRASRAPLSSFAPGGVFAIPFGADIEKVMSFLYSLPTPELQDAFLTETYQVMLKQQRGEHIDIPEHFRP